MLEHAPETAPRLRCYTGGVVDRPFDSERSLADQSLAAAFSLCETTARGASFPPAEFSDAGQAACITSMPRKQLAFTSKTSARHVRQATKGEKAFEQGVGHRPVPSMRGVRVYDACVPLVL